MLLYDVTTLYLEAEKEDELRKVGYSKERRVDPQIVAGMLVDRFGHPLEIAWFEGNKPETHTINPLFLGLSRTVTKSRTWSSWLMPGGCLPATWMPSMPPGCDSSSAPGTRRRLMIWQYSRKRAVRDGQTLTAQEHRAIDIIKGRKPAKKARFVTTSGQHATLDTASLERARGLVGLKDYVTNITADVMPATEISSNYDNLWHVEQSFRMSNTDLTARPIFHHTRDAIEAHFTIVFAALAIARELQERSGTSLKKIIQTLQPLRHVTIRIGDQHLEAEPTIPNNVAELLTTLGH